MVREYDSLGKPVWDFSMPGGPHSAVRLPNGNTVICNWLGHNSFGQAPHLIEVTPDKHAVWTFADHQTMKTISSVVLLDVPGDAIRGTILH